MEVAENFVWSLVWDNDQREATFQAVVGDLPVLGSTTRAYIGQNDHSEYLDYVFT